MKKYLDRFSRRTKRVAGTAVILGVAAICLTACNTTPQAIKVNQQISNRNLSQFEQAQPTPSFKWSQQRQTLIDVESAEADTTQTTTFFFNQGVTSPIMSCPSIGFPVGYSDTLTSPDQAIKGPTGGDTAVVGEIDPDGVYQADSSGTYVLCVDGQGQTFGTYWEGFVYTVAGPATYDTATKAIKLTGPPSYHFKVGKNDNG